METIMFRSKPVFIWMSWNSYGEGIDKIRWAIENYKFSIFSHKHGDKKNNKFMIVFMLK